MITVRIANKDDVSRILEIAESSISPAWTQASVQERLGRDDSLLLVAEEWADSLRVVGFAAFRQVGDAGELLQIAVDAENRCRGIGGFLLSAIIEHAAGSNLASVFLEVRAGNDTAIAFYKKHGFEEVRIRKDYYTNPTENAIVMCRGDLWSPAGERSSPLRKPEVL